jgi:penicillin-binding protein 1C
MEARRAYVLRRMARAGYASAEEAELARKSHVEIRAGGDELAAYQFFFHVAKKLPAGATEVRLTLDRDTQQMVAEQVRVVLAGLAERNVTNAAAVVLDNHTGEVLAYVGSASFFDVKHSGQVDGVQAVRQPGSSLKPFVYALALEHGFTPATVLPDVPTAYPMAPGQEYAPENYANTFHGPVLLRTALANSFNVPACHVASRLGVQEVLGQLHRFGYRSLDRTADYYGLGVVLGGGEVKLYEQARAYMALANGGELREPVEALEVNGKPTDAAPPPARVCEPVTTYLITDILSDHNARILSFGPRSALNLPFPCAAKTGTSSGHRDNWTLGYTRDHTVAVWVGNFDGSEMLGVSGITGAGPLFARIMYHLYRNRPEPEPWRRPPGVVRRPVCSLSGCRPNPYCPHAKDELFPESALHHYETQPCTWHREAGVEVPEEFRVDSQP